MNLNCISVPPKWWALKFEG